MPTIHDVAKKAGVAPITVSRVINNSDYVSDSVRERVNQAIEELGYVPNVIARSLKSKKTNTLALIFTDITNPFFNVLARGVEDAAFDAGYTVVFCNTDESQKQEDIYVQMLLQKQVDGILLVPAQSDSKSVELIKKQNTPLVVIDREVKNGDVDIVRGDSEDGAFQLTEHLIKLGHKKISLLSGPSKVSTSIDRVEGYKRAMKKNGLESFIDFTYGEYSQASGYDCTMKIFSRKDKPTAIFAGNNFISIGVLAALKELGIKVPDEIALASFDDIPEYLTPISFLTVVTQPPYEMGEKATQLLIQRIEEDTPSEYQKIVFPVKLIVRESSGDSLSDIYD